MNNKSETQDLSKKEIKELAKTKLEYVSREVGLVEKEFSSYAGYLHNEYKALAKKVLDGMDEASKEANMNKLGYNMELVVAPKYHVFDNVHDNNFRQNLNHIASFITMTSSQNEDVMNELSRLKNIREALTLLDSNVIYIKALGVSKEYFDPDKDQQTIADINKILGLIDASSLDKDSRTNEMFLPIKQLLESTISINNLVWSNSDRIKNILGIPRSERNKKPEGRKSRGVFAEPLKKGKVEEFFDTLLSLPPKRESRK